MNATQHDDTGFNFIFGKTWVYPTNLPVRKYQKEIVEEALFKNTMVCLPTGLGKTFIAAVVMYNYFRWYPSGKVIFMATTKPLVKQQVDACYEIVAIPKSATAELTGSVIKKNRQTIWEDNRVFFVTPQVLQNDLNTVPTLGSKIKLLVIDEAHRARGNHAYCEVIKKLFEVNQNFRVLALTATPASNVLEVINVCKQLLISHLEVRTEDSQDVVPYLYHKSVQTIVLKLDGKLSEIIEDFKRVLDKYLRILLENNVIHSNVSSLHKGRLFYLSKEYQEKNSHCSATDKYKLIMKVFAICTILYHAYDLLLRHGMRSFAKFLEESINKPLLIGCCSDIQELLASINDYLGPSLLCTKLPDGSHVKLPENFKFGHPKFYKLRDVVRSHFSVHDENSKVIIFCEYKDSVEEVHAALLDQPCIKPTMFMGQSRITQKQQVHIIESFRNGSFNTLISTCIGEEGIDVGFVDLVLCFDISSKSSVRFIQRIGRTGRDRNGKVVILVSQGREQQILKDCLAEKERLCNALVQAKNIDDQLYKNNPRMIPTDVTPECQELFIVPNKTSSLTNFITSDLPRSKVAVAKAKSDLPPTRSLRSMAKKAGGKVDKKQADIRSMFKQCTQVPKFTAEEPIGLNTLLQEKIGHILAMGQDCKLCKSFENASLKREFVPINGLNLKLKLNFNVKSVQLLQKQFNQKSNTRHDIERTHVISPIGKRELETIPESYLDDFRSPSRLDAPINKRHSVELSPDLFDDDFPEVIPSQFEAELRSKIDQQIKTNTATVVATNCSSLDMNPDESDIIESSPSPIVNKRKPSKSSFSSNHARKRIKFDLAACIDALPTRVNQLKKKITAKDVLGFDFSEVAAQQCNTPSSSGIIKEAEANSIGESTETDSNRSSPDLFSSHSITEPFSMRKKKNIILTDIVDTSLFNTMQPVNHVATTESCETMRSESNIHLTTLKSKSALTQNKSSVSLVEIEEDLQQSSSTTVTQSHRRRYFDSQAVVSRNQHVSSDDDICTQDDVYETSFVDDEDAATIPSSQTQAMYLKSVKTPIVREKPFRRPAAIHVNDTCVEPETIDLTYAKDSFCVDDFDALIVDESLDELEKAELVLKKRSKCKIIDKSKRKRRIRRILSDSD